MLILLTKIDDVKNFVGAANACLHETLLRSGNYCVNAKSILGVFSLDLDKPVELVIEGDKNAEDVKTFLQEIAGYIVTKD